MEPKVRALNLPISTKQSVEICNTIRNKTVKQAKAILNRIIEHKQAVPYKRYNKDTPHRTGKIAAGRFPITASTQILLALNSAESNALQEGHSDNLVLTHISAHKAGTQHHYGRKRSRKRKATHLNIILKEQLKENQRKPVKTKNESKVEDKDTEIKTIKPNIIEQKATKSKEEIKSDNQVDKIKQSI